MRNLHAGEGGEVYRVLSTGVLVYWNFLSENVIEHCPKRIHASCKHSQGKIAAVGSRKRLRKGFFQIGK